MILRRRVAMWMWFCVLFGSAVLLTLGYLAMKYGGQWAMKRDEAERAKLTEEWKRRAAERRAKASGGAAAPEEEAGENPPMY